MAHPALAALGGRVGLLAHALQAHRNPFRGGPGRVRARLEALAITALRGKGLLGLLAPARHLAQLSLCLVATRARRPGSLLGGAQLLAGRACRISSQRVARLERLALEALVEIRGLGLALERPQPRASLALHVERAAEVLLGALKLELRAAPPLAVLAEPGGFLDQQPAVAWAREHDLLHLALGDDRVHLLAQAGVGEHLDHVHQAAARPVQPVLALAVASQQQDQPNQ